MRQHVSFTRSSCSRVLIVLQCTRLIHFKLHRVQNLANVPLVLILSAYFWLWTYRIRKQITNKIQPILYEYYKYNKLHVYDKEKHHAYRQNYYFRNIFLFSGWDLVLKLLLIVPTNVVICATLYRSRQLLVVNLFFKWNKTLWFDMFVN